MSVVFQLVRADEPIMFSAEWIVGNDIYPELVIEMPALLLKLLHQMLLPPPLLHQQVVLEELSQATNRPFQVLSKNFHEKF